MMRLMADQKHGVTPPTMVIHDADRFVGTRHLYEVSRLIADAMGIADYPQPVGETDRE